MTIHCVRVFLSAFEGCCQQSRRCHPERSEGPLRLQERSLAALGMTVVSYGRRALSVVAAAQCLVEVVQKVARLLDADRQPQQVGRAGRARSFDAGPVLYEA